MWFNGAPAAAAAHTRTHKPRGMEVPRLEIQYKVKLIHTQKLKPQ